MITCNLNQEPSDLKSSYEELLHEIDQLLQLAEIDSESASQNDLWQKERVTEGS